MPRSSVTPINEIYLNAYNIYEELILEAKRRQKTSPTTQRNANRLAALLKPEAKTNKQRREQLNRALSK